MTNSDFFGRDICLLWIQRKLDKGATWNEVSMGCKKSDDELETFLQHHIDDDDWPQMTVSEWKTMVDGYHKHEDMQEPVQFRII